MFEIDNIVLNEKEILEGSSFWKKYAFSFTSIFLFILIMNILRSVSNPKNAQIDWIDFIFMVVKICSFAAVSISLIQWYQWNKVKNSYLYKLYTFPKTFIFNQDKTITININNRPEFRTFSPISTSDLKEKESYQKILSYIINRKNGLQFAFEKYRYKKWYEKLGKYNQRVKLKLIQLTTSLKDI